jgi:hypothetical protein
MKDDAAFVDRCFDACPDPERGGRSATSPVRLWFGLVFLAMGVLAILDAAGTVAWSKTFEEWWPLAVVGWGLAAMLGDRRVTLGGVLITAIGVTLLADEQGWTAEALVWSALFVLVGVAILLSGSPGRHEDARDDRAASPVEPTSRA